MSEPAPRLREGVSVTAEGGVARLADAASGFGVEVDGGVARLAAAIDGRRTVAELAAGLAGEGLEVGPDDVLRVLELLDSMFLLDNERGRARAAAARTAAARPRAPGLTVLADARFDCHACGYCCSNGQKFGPLAEEDRARVLAHEWRGVIPGVRGPEDLFYEVAGEGGRREGLPSSPADDGAGGAPKIFLRQRGGRCVFLTEENLCAIHKRLGAEAKPHVCRMFPYAAVETPEGTVVSTRWECKSLALSRASGTAVAAQAAAIERLVLAAPDSARVGALVQWSARVAAPYEVADAVRRAALRVLEAPGRSYEPGLLQVRDLVLGTARRLGDRPGEPEIEAALRFAGGPAAAAPEAAPPAAQAEALRALGAILADMYDAAGKSYFFLASEGDAGAIRLEMHEVAVVAALTILARIAPYVPAPARALPPFDVERLAALEAGPAAEGVFRDAARHEIFGWQVCTRQPLLAGYGALALRYVLAKWIARRRAAGRGAPEVEAEDAHEGVLVATRTLAAPANHRAATADMRRLMGFYRGLAFGVI